MVWGWDEMVWCGVVWYGMVWYGMVWGMVWCGMVWYGVVWYGMVWCGVVWCGMVWYGVVWYGMVWYGVVWYGMVWCGVVWYGMGYGMVWYGMDGIDVELLVSCVASTGAEDFYVAETGRRTEGIAEACALDQSTQVSRTPSRGSRARKICLRSPLEEGRQTACGTCISCRITFYTIYISHGSRRTCIRA
jgi:chloride channel 2